MRPLRAASTVALAGLTLTLALPAASAFAAPGDPGEPIELTLMSTTDVHGHVRDWDYFRNEPYPATDALGLTRVATAVEEVRAEKGEESVFLFDSGDAIQGTPLTYYYGFGDGRQGVLDGTTTHPMATAFNTIGYDALSLGNHEFNYGLDLLDAYDRDLNAPLLGANVLDPATGEPVREPYTLIDREIDGEEVTVGVIGLVTPGVRIWDKQYVDGVLEFQDTVEAAKKWVPIVDEQADVVVVVVHSGQGTVEDADYDPAALTEDAANNIATQVPGIDVMTIGHSHQDVPRTVLTNVAGEQVLITQPDFWAGSVSEVTLNLLRDAQGDLAVDWSGANVPTVTPRYGRDIPTENAELVDAIEDQHATTVDYVNTEVATSVTELSAVTSRYEDTPIIDFINNVQAKTVDAALDGTEYADVPVISQASPFSRTAVFPEGPVTIRDIAGLYIYENTLRGVQMTGAEVRAYLEYSARYFNQVETGAAFDPETGTNAVVDDPRGIPDYNYDVLSGLDYYIDISQPANSRIGGLSLPDGTPVADDDVFIMAVNNYRQSGGGGYPGIADAPVVYDELLEIRQLLIEWAEEREVIDPADFFVENWRLVTEPQAVAPGTDVGAGVVPGSATDELAATGAVTGGLALPAGALLLAGLALWSVSRRRRITR